MRKYVDLENKIFQYIQNHEGCSYTDIKKEMNKDNKIISYYLGKLKRSYHIVKINDRYYMINEKERESFQNGKLNIDLKSIISKNIRYW